MTESTWRDASPTALLAVQNLSKTYGEGSKAVRAIGDLSFSVREDEFLSIVGPSGAGKTTLLKCLSGLLAPTSGSVILDGKVVKGPPSSLALVFQDYNRSLLPWLTIRENVELPLKGFRQRIAAAERRSRSDEALSAVGLSAFSKSHPWQLSGGMQQRVAIARAVAYQPRLLLMDEPFASVDAQTRTDLEDLVLRIREEYKMTVVFVTHDIDESVYLSDRVLVLSPSPTTVRRELIIDLPTPRDQMDTRAHPDFAGLRNAIYQDIKRPKAVPSPQH